QFLINQNITFLNFGSFGACVKPVFNELIRLQTLLEFEPVQFITVNGPRYLAASRKALAQFINCNMDDVVYVPNPSFAVNLVAKNLKLKAGDEILTTNLEYGACDKTWEFYCNEWGAKYVRQPVTLPLTDTQTFVNDFFKGLTPRTRLIFISHITSTTALKFPVDEICAKAKEMGLLTFVDGAHAPGHVAINLGLLKADFYTGACHKWMMTPKGSSFLYADKKLQPMLNPLIVSWGYNSNMASNSTFMDYHQFNGTRDFSAYLTIPTAITFMQQNNWDEVGMHCHKLVVENATRFCALFETEPLSPLNNNFIGQMCSIPVNTNHPVELQQHLFNAFKIEVPVMCIDGKTYIRYSIQAFNTQSDLDKLYDALATIKQKGKLLLQ
ncbi:MAG TPA: aminotransferase class V-fold PLP-dependent enzyme, partial [Bacteroidia bacterium]|nr:aminotransferase class V-fold PLP-dependent enzyme [Bacteroidia bacterium]